MEFCAFQLEPCSRQTGPERQSVLLLAHQGAGRVDDRDYAYQVLYVGDSPEGVMAEAIGRFARWTPDIFDVPFLSVLGTVKALARFEGDPSILNLDDPYVLQQFRRRPSQVVSRDRDITQRWARDIYDLGEDDGVSWWSYYDPQWSSFGLWELSELRQAADPEVIDLENDAVISAASSIRRVIDERRVHGKG